MKGAILGRSGLPLGCILVFLGIICRTAATAAVATTSKQIITVGRRNVAGLVGSNRNNETLLEQLSKTTCEICKKNFKKQSIHQICKDAYVPNHPPVAIAVLTDRPSPTLLAIAAGILNECMPVTLFTIGTSYSKHQKRNIQSQILSSLPCDKEAAAHHLLSLRPVVLQQEHAEILECLWKQPPHKNPNNKHYVSPFSSCALDNTEPIYKALFQATNHVGNAVPVVMITEIHLLGVLFLAEHFGISSIAIGSVLDRTLLQSPSSWRQQPLVEFMDNVYSLWMTRHWLQLNRIRMHLGFKTRIPHPTHLFGTSISAYLIDSFGPTPHHMGPVFGPAIDCKTTNTPPNAATNKQILVLPPPNLKTAQMRALVRGLSFAQDSIQESSPCQGCNKSSTVDCKIVWLDSQEAPPLLPPSFEVVQSNHSSVAAFLETAAQNPNIVAVVGPCNSDSISLGVPQVCISDPMGASNLRFSTTRELAVGILRLVVAGTHKHRIMVSNHQFAMHRVLTIVRQSIVLGQQSGLLRSISNDPSNVEISWTTGSTTVVAGNTKKATWFRATPGIEQDRRKITKIHIQSTPNATTFPKTTVYYPSFLSIVAWFILFMAVLYCMFRRERQSLRLLRLARRSLHPDATLLDELTSRLVELDQAIDWASEWWEELLRNNRISHDSSSNTTKAPRRHHHHRKTKKR